MIKKRLFTPGPTMVPDEVVRAMTKPIVHHRHQEFIEIYKRINENLRYLFQTRDDVFTLACSGTGAMETAVCNLLSPGDIALYVNGGKFGARWGEICTAYGVKTEELKVEWGRSVDPEEVGICLKRNSRIKAVFITHTETSTGALNDIKEISRIVHEFSDAVVIVDGITSVGAVELKTDDWKLDVVLTASQKGLMIPPGLAFISVNDRAWKLIECSTLPKYYFDLKKNKQALSNFQTPWTPAISLIFGLDTALGIIRTEGIENVWARHSLLASAFRAGIEALDFHSFAKSQSEALTAISIPSDINGQAFLETLRNKYGFIVAGGQGELKGKIFRVAHIGNFDEFDVISILSALEMTLQSFGRKFENGVGVKTAQKILFR